MIETSPHYAFTVSCAGPKSSIYEGNNVLLPCQKVLALIRSSKNSKPNAFDGGFKLVTSGVEDLFSTEDSTGEASKVKHTLSAMCTLTNLPQYRLDPPRGGTQHALVTVTAKANDAFVVESVQLLTPDEAAQSKKSMIKLLHLAIHIHGRDRKRADEWSDSFSPANAKTCRRVGRFPTDAALPDP